MQNLNIYSICYLSVNELCVCSVVVGKISPWQIILNTQYRPVIGNCILVNFKLKRSVVLQRKIVKCQFASFVHLIKFTIGEWLWSAMPLDHFEEHWQNNILESTL